MENKIRCMYCCALQHEWDNPGSVSEANYTFKGISLCGRHLRNVIEEGK